MPNYKIRAISKDKPTEYFNQKYNSTTYYITVMFEGESRPTEVGKKSPDALKVGDVLDGDIIPKPDFPADGFKATPKPFGGAQGSFGGNTNAYAGSAKPAYKDNSDGMRQGMCFNNAASWVTEHERVDTPEQWATKVYAYANALYKLGDLGKELPTTTHSAPLANMSDAEAASLYQSVAASDFPGDETVPESDLPAGF